MSLISLFSELKPHQYLKKTEGGWEISDQKATSLVTICKEIIIETNRYNFERFEDLKKFSKTYCHLYERISYFSKKHYYLTYYLRFLNAQDREFFETSEKALDSLVQCAAKLWKGNFLILYNTCGFNLYDSILCENLHELQSNKMKLKELQSEISWILERGFNANGILRELQKAKQTCEIDMAQLKVQAWQNLENTRCCHTFLYKVLYCAMNHIKQRELSQGFVWRIKNDQGIYCYFIGAIHWATKKMAEAPLITHAIANSSKFYFEPSYFLMRMDSIMRRLIPSWLFPFKYGIDFSTFEKANQKKEHIEGLETFF